MEQDLGRFPDGTGLSPTAEPLRVSSADAASIPSAWEAFRDASYYDMWCVRPVGERRFGHGFHLVSEDEAVVLCDYLTELHDALDNLERENRRLREQIAGT